MWDSANNFQWELGPALLLQMAHCRMVGPTVGAVEGLSWRQEQEITMRSPFNTNWGTLSLKKKGPNACLLTPGSCLSHCSAGLTLALLLIVNNYKYTRYNLAYVSFFGKSNYTNY